MEWQSQYPSLEFQLEATCNLPAVVPLPQGWHAEEGIVSVSLAPSATHPPKISIQSTWVRWLCLSFLSFFLGFFCDLQQNHLRYIRLLALHTLAGLAFFHFSSSFRRQHTMSVWWIALPILALVMSPSTSSAAEGEWVYLLGFNRKMKKRCLQNHGKSLRLGIRFPERFGTFAQ